MLKQNQITALTELCRDEIEENKDWITTLKQKEEIEAWNEENEFLRDIMKELNLLFKQQEKIKEKKRQDTTIIIEDCDKSNIEQEINEKAEARALEMIKYNEVKMD